MCTMALLVSSTDLSHTFVAGGQEDDGDEGENEGEGVGDAPLGEYDAQVLR